MVELAKQNYDENKKIFETVEMNLRKKLGNIVPIDHVGSTAIPYINYGKNIIDIVIGAIDNQQFEEIKKNLENEGFVPSQKSRDEIYQFFSSIAGETGSGDVHIHLVIMDTERYNEFIVLRNYLLNNQDEAINYSNFKVEILELGKTDRREYKRVKSEYVFNLLNKAKIWGKNNQ
ncbi:MAG: GrpB family protein [Bacilli bacterium]